MESAKEQIMYLDVQIRSERHARRRFIYSLTLKQILRGCRLLLTGSDLLPAAPLSAT
jgi:hypothetical protein